MENDKEEDDIDKTVEKDNEKDDIDKDTSEGDDHDSDTDAARLTRAQELTTLNLEEMDTN